MRRRLQLLPSLLRVLAVGALGLLALHADTTLTVGGTPNIFDQFPFPFGGGNVSGEFQQVYDSSLFSGVSGPITIDSLTFQDTQNLFGFSPDQVDPAEYAISLVETSQTVSSFLSDTNTNGLQVVGGTTVFQSSQPGCPFSGVNQDGTCDLAGTSFTINFSKTFSYDPTAGNLLLDVIKTDGSQMLSMGLDISSYSGCIDLLNCSSPPSTPLMAAAFTDYSAPCYPSNLPCAIPEGLITGFGYTVANTTVPEPDAFPLVIVWVGLGAAYVLRKRAMEAPVGRLRR